MSYAVTHHMTSSFEEIQIFSLDEFSCSCCIWSCEWIENVLILRVMYPMLYFPPGGIGRTRGKCSV